MRAGPNTATLQFIGTLVDFFPNQSEDHYARHVYFKLHPAVKDLIESLGVPHVEVFALKVNGQFCPLTYNVQDGDKLIIYPKAEANNISTEERINKPWPIPQQFVADVHLGKLARLLRLLGIDTIYNDDMDDPEIIETALNKDRVVITRDLQLLKHGRLQHGYWLRSSNPDEQIREVLEYFELADKTKPFTRCMSCNGLLKPVPKESILDQIPNKVKHWCEEYRQCARCEKIYWKGSHYEKLVEKVDKILDF